MKVPRVPVIISVTNECVSGVNSYVLNLAIGLQEEGWKTRVLRAHGPLPEGQNESFENLDVDVLDCSSVATWRGRWGLLRRYLEAKAPCIYIANHDQEFSAFVPRLEDRIRAIGVLHSDEEYHYGHFERMADALNAWVCVSGEVAAEAVRRAPEYAEKVVVIPNAVPMPSFRKRSVQQGLRILYAGRLESRQKRVQDLIPMVAGCERREVNFRLDIMGEGPQEAVLRKALEQNGRVRFHGAVQNAKVLEAMADADVLLLPSAYEGLPMVLLEAMARGCVPVATRVRSGVGDLIEDGRNGFLFDVGEIERAVECLDRLSRTPALRERLALAAMETIRDGPWNQKRQIEKYVDLFERVRTGKNPFHRRRGRPRPPKSADPSLVAEARAWIGFYLKQPLLRSCGQWFRVL